MGVLIPNYRERTEVVFNGQTVRGLATRAGVQAGTILGLSDGKPQGSRVDGSVYVTARVSIVEGKFITVTAYGEELVGQLKKFQKGDEFTAVLEPFGTVRSNGQPYRLVKVLSPLPNHEVPAAVIETAVDTGIDESLEAA